MECAVLPTTVCKSVTILNQKVFRKSITKHLYVRDPHEHGTYPVNRNRVSTSASLQLGARGHRAHTPADCVCHTPSMRPHQKRRK